MPDPRRTQDVLRSLQETMDTAEYGYEMLVNGKPPEKSIGLRNLTVFGRAVTNVLQNLRSTEQDFDEWYKKYRIEMESDPLMSYFYDLRSEILKEGQMKVGVKAHIEKMYPALDLQRFGPPPPNAKSFFIGDSLGGTGWEVQLPDGSIEKYYVDLPSDIGMVTLTFQNPPRSHIGKEITDNSVQSLSRHYLNYLQQMVKDAKTRFAQK
jgi:hypothetical protein